MIASNLESVSFPGDCEGVMSEHEVDSMNIKSVRKMSDSEKGRTVIGKADSRYWQQHGKLLLDQRSRFYACKIQVAGRRESFPLRTANKSAAANKAAMIFSDVVAFGWEAALAKHKPNTVKPARPAKPVGALLAEVQATAGFRLSTFTVYAQSLRQIVSEMAEIGDQPALDENGEPQRDKKKRIIYLSHRAHRGGGREAWLAKVDMRGHAIAGRANRRCSPTLEAGLRSQGRCCS